MRMFGHFVQYFPACCIRLHHYYWLSHSDKDKVCATILLCACVFNFCPGAWFLGLCWPCKTGIPFFDLRVLVVDMVRNCVLQIRLKVAWAHRFWCFSLFFALNGPVFAAAEGFSARRTRRRGLAALDVYRVFRVYMARPRRCVLHGTGIP